MYIYIAQIIKRFLICHGLSQQCMYCSVYCTVQYSVYICTPLIRSLCISLVYLFSKIVAITASEDDLHHLKAIFIEGHIAKY